MLQAGNYIEQPLSSLALLGQTWDFNEFEVSMPSYLNLRVRKANRL